MNGSPMIDRPVTEEDLMRLYREIEGKMFNPLVMHLNRMDDDVKRLMTMVSALLERERARLH